MSWRELMTRVFLLDVLKCDECGGRMKIIAEITDREVVARILSSLGVPTEVPEIARARPPPQIELELGKQADVLDDIHTP